MTNHLEGLCTVDEINEKMAYLNNKIVEAKKRASDKLKSSNVEGTGEFISVTLPTSKNKNPRHKVLLMFLIILS